MSSTYGAGNAWDGPIGHTGRTCAGCGRPAGGTTCLACSLQVRFASVPSAVTVHRSGSAPAPVVVVQAVILLPALTAGYVAIHALALAVPLSIASIVAAPTPVRAWIAVLDLGLLFGSVWMLALAAGGLWAVNALHRGRPLARLLLTALLVIDVVALVDAGTDPLPRAALALHLLVITLLWAPETARRHFRR